jgi:hypothetical protein
LKTRSMKRWRQALAWLALASAASGAQAAAVGTIFGTPHIGGIVVPGEFAEAKEDLTGHFDKPLSLNIDPRSNAREVMHIGLWLREQKPAIELRNSCVGSCAMFMLGSGRSLKIAKGTVVAFGTQDEWIADLADQVQAGKISTDDERSQASAARFLDRMKARIGYSNNLREQATQDSWLPPAMLSFVRELTGHPTIQKLSFDEQRADLAFGLASNQCLWWVPDAEGMKQLRLEVRDYQPVSRAAAAKLLKVPDSMVYVGPALLTLPQDPPLCQHGNQRLNLGEVQH